MTIPKSENDNVEERGMKKVNKEGNRKRKQNVYINT